MTQPKTLISLDIRSTLKRPLRELRGFAHPDGRAMSPREAQTALQNELANGRELLPIGKPHVFAITAKT